MRLVVYIPLLLPLVAAARQARNLPGRGRIVYTEDKAADAYTLPGWPCRIVVTTGMLNALSQPERRVLLAHERAHAAWLHYLFISATRAHDLHALLATAHGTAAFHR